MSRSIRLVIFAVAVAGLVATLLVIRARSGWAIAEWEQAEHRCVRLELPGYCALAGWAYEHGEGPKEDEARALSLYARGCAGHAYDSCAYEELLRLKHEQGEAAREEIRIKLQRSCFDRQVAFACSSLGQLAEEGAWEEAFSTSLALRAWKHGCEQLKDASACGNAGRLLTQRGSEPELKMARGYFAAGCRQGDVAACRKNADALACGRGSPRDSSQAIQQYLSLCRDGDQTSCLMAADHHAVADDETRKALPSRLHPIFRLQAISAVATGWTERANDLRDRLEPVESAWIGAGLALDAGDFNRARRALEQMEAGRPGTVEARLFREVVNAVEAGASAMEALLRAWNDSGRPDLRPNGLVRPNANWAEVGCQPDGGPRLSSGLVRRLPVLYPQTVKNSHPPDEVRDLAAAIPTIAPLGERLGALSVLRARAPDERRKVAWDEGQARLAQSFASGASLFELLIHLGLRPEQEPLSPDERTRLGQTTGWRVAKASLRAEVELAAIRLPADARWTASDVLGAVVELATVADAYRLVGRARATVKELDEQQRKVFGETLVRVGREVVDGGWLLEMAHGIHLLRVGAELTGAEEDVAAHQARSQEFQEIYLGGIVPGLGIWPSRTIQDSFIELLGDDEVAAARGIRGLARR